MLVKDPSVDRIVNRQNLRKSKMKRHWPNTRYGWDWGKQPKELRQNFLYIVFYYDKIPDESRRWFLNLQTSLISVLDVAVTIKYNLLNNLKALVIICMHKQTLPVISCWRCDVNLTML